VKNCLQKIAFFPQKSPLHRLASLAAYYVNKYLRVFLAQLIVIQCAVNCESINAGSSILRETGSLLFKQSKQINQEPMSFQESELRIPRYEYVVRLEGTEKTSAHVKTGTSEANTQNVC